MPNGYRRFRSAPLVTIAMVTYNSARFVREAIESALAQDFEDFELVVCDDFSTDATWDIVKSFDDRRIRAYRNDTNLGEYLNRNKALGLARGRYLMYLDGDDLLYPHAIGALASAMERHPAAGFASCLPACEKFVYPVELTAGEFTRCVYLGPNVLANDFTQLFFRTEALRNKGGLHQRYCSGDTQIQVALGMRENVLLMATGLAWWRRRKGQASEAVRNNGKSVAERWRYCVEGLADPACPLDSGEKAMGRRNLTRLVLRHALRLLSQGQARDAVDLAFRTGIEAWEWPCLARGYEHPFLGEVTGDNPMRESSVGVPASTIAVPQRKRPLRRPSYASRATVAPLPLSGALELAE